MGLETGNYIDDLNESWPLGTDKRSTSDDHQRLIKKVLKNSFSNISGEVSASQSQLNVVRYFTGINSTVSATAGELNNIIRSDQTASLSVAKRFGDNTELRFGDDDDFRQRHTGSSMESALVNGWWDIYGDNFSTTRFRFTTDGKFHADDDLIAFSTTVGSDPRLKEDVRRIEDAVLRLNALNGVTFRWKKNGAPSGGLISTDVKEALPEAVTTIESLSDPGVHYEHVNYNAVIGLLVEAVNTLSERVSRLEG